ncbi:sulfotransferase [Leptolyngbya sp. FACHB-671]|uniref:sulfotransferase family protein n=1 Tax=Leptolyngbya sp. FACHB-671 TaxID=2692812 RepID=UPI00168A327A|nr:sulfotransferase [Leptolyngbya sp. FACHB-671]
MQIGLLKERPVFIFGMGRSGTTLLRLMLTAHPQFCVPSECLFFVRLEPKYGHLEDISDRLGSFLADLYKIESFADWKLDPELLRRNLSQFPALNYATAIATVYRTYLEQIGSDARFWGDKNPVHVYYTEQIQKYFPNAKLLLIIRDVRGTYGSLKRTEESFDNWQGSCQANVLSVTKQWHKVVDLSEQHKNDPNFHTVLYERLIENPEQELRAVCSWLGVDFDESMLRYYEKNAKEKLVPTGENGWNAKTFQPISKGRLNSWQNELSLTELEALESLNQGNLQRLGYQCVTQPFRYRSLLKVLPDYVDHAFWRLAQIAKLRSKRQKLYSASPSS